MRPTREPATHTQQTYMVTAATWGRRELFRNDRWAELLIDTLKHYRGRGYLLHEFAIMPDHLHVILTPLTSLERAVQFIKGGFSYRAKKELGSNLEVWQAGFSDHRIRDAGDYRVHVIYVRQNPVRKSLCEMAEQDEYSSASGRYELDGVPQGLKPPWISPACGAAKAAPFQSKPMGVGEAVPFQSRPMDVGEAVPFQSKPMDAGDGAALHRRRARRGDGAAVQSTPTAQHMSAEARDRSDAEELKIAPKSSSEMVEGSLLEEKLAVNGRGAMTSRRATGRGPTTESR